MSGGGMSTAIRLCEADSGPVEVAAGGCTKERRRARKLAREEACRPSLTLDARRCKAIAAVTACRPCSEAASSPSSCRALPTEAGGEGPAAPGRATIAPLPLLEAPESVTDPAASGRAAAAATRPRMLAMVDVKSSAVRTAAAARARFCSHSA